MFLVTAGSFYPCCQEDECAGENAAQSSDHHSDDCKDKGFCSPFSACASCAVSMEIPSDHITMQAILPARPQYSIYHAAGHEGIYPALFQPPRSC